MTRDEKIEALAEELRNVARGGSPEPMWTVVARSVQDRIDAATTNWTRVENGLPTVSNYYLVTRLWADDQKMVSEAFFQLSGGWELSNILAWAPLPEPWRG